MSDTHIILSYIRPVVSILQMRAVRPRRLNNVPKVTQLLSNKAGNGTRDSGFSSLGPTHCLPDSGKDHSLRFGQFGGSN